MAGNVSTAADLASAALGVVAYVLMALAVLFGAFCAVSIAFLLILIRRAERDIRRQAARSAAVRGEHAAQLGDDAIAEFGHDLGKEIDQILREHGQ